MSELITPRLPTPSATDSHMSSSTLLWNELASVVRTGLSGVRQTVMRTVALDRNAWIKVGQVTASMAIFVAFVLKKGIIVIENGSEEDEDVDEEEEEETEEEEEFEDEDEDEDVFDGEDEFDEED